MVPVMATPDGKEAQVDEDSAFRELPYGPLDRSRNCALNCPYHIVRTLTFPNKTKQVQDAGKCLSVPHLPAIPAFPKKAGRGQPGRCAFGAKKPFTPG
jgi:hypothetical protein